MAIWKPELKAVECLKKIERPILTKDDIPYEAELVFNAGVAKIKGKYVMVFRDDYGATREEYAANLKRITKTAIGIAVSDNGIDGWEVADTPLIHYDCTDKSAVKNLLGGENFCPDVQRIYDPRITVIDDKLYLCLAMDTAHGIRGCIAELSDDLKHVDIISVSAPDNRNMVLFPEKINGYYMRLERPFTVYSRGGQDRFDIWISSSPDLKFWGESKLLMGVEHVPFSNDKIGPAAPPIKTEYGWLTTFHAVDKESEGRGQSEWTTWWNKRYTAGIMLLDLNDPSKVIGMCKQPIIVPELPHEADCGFRHNVIFPGGMILEDDGEVKIYYGAADTVECVATARLEDLIALCKDPL
jgi:beta-1,4-mannooligosaccharide/beta-1,4-mannosyl-N-acetylglucosamine phosphorylase